jgi:tRNA A-37 threonylcarbamoyl transferase component Bud32
MPAKNSVSNSLHRKFQASTLRDNQQFGRIRIAGWAGHFFKQFKFPRPWSAASQMHFEQRDWESEWPNLLARIESDQLMILKRTRSGDVLEGELILAGRPVHVIVKRPRRKFLRQRIFGMLTRTRARRIWDKAWKLIVRNMPCEWPLLIVEKRTRGYVTDSIIVLEKVQGQTLATINLDSLDEKARERMFYRLGRALRRLEQLGFTHFDAKSTNWIIRDDAHAGLLPILIDADSVRHYVWTAEGIRRLLRSMKDHPQYTPADSLALCQGYAPRARIVREDASESALQSSHDPMDRRADSNARN